MNKYLILFLLVFVGKWAQAQTDTSKVANVAVFSPLYLDSCFNAKGYKYGKLVPRFAIPGVEFYFGANMALDSLKREGTRVNVHMYDSKSTTRTIKDLVTYGELKKMDMIIASASGTDVKLLADFAQQQQVPLISATYPNDAQVTNNPYFVVANPTLRAHCENMYQYLQKNFSTQKVVMLTRPGKTEDRIQQYYKEFEKNSSQKALSIKTVDLGSDFDPDSLGGFIDTTGLTAYIVGSTDAAFAKKIADGLVALKQQENAILIGMPTWDDIKDFSKKDYEGLAFYYPNPMTTPGNRVASAAASKFKTRYGSTAGEYMYRGYETVYHFIKLLMKYQTDIASNLGDKSHFLFTTYNIQPVMLNAGNMTLDYFENKKVHIIKKLNGTWKVVN
jgi:ABC-type branched-subunit amino acid transport system substrate-binding protein